MSYFRTYNHNFEFLIASHALKIMGYLWVLCNTPASNVCVYTDLLTKIFLIKQKYRKYND